MGKKKSQAKKDKSGHSGVGGGGFTVDDDVVEREPVLSSPTDRSDPVAPSAAATTSSLPPAAVDRSVTTAAASVWTQVFGDDTDSLADVGIPAFYRRAIWSALQSWSSGSEVRAAAVVAPASVTPAPDNDSAMPIAVLHRARNLFHDLRQRSADVAAELPDTAERENDFFDFKAKFYDLSESNSGGKAEFVVDVVALANCARGEHGPASRRTSSFLLIGVANNGSIATVVDDIGTVDATVLNGVLADSVTPRLSVFVHEFFVDHMGSARRAALIEIPHEFPGGQVYEIVSTATKLRKGALTACMYNWARAQARNEHFARDHSHVNAAALQNYIASYFRNDKDAYKRSVLDWQARVSSLVGNLVPSIKNDEFLSVERAVAALRGGIGDTTFRVLLLSLEGASEAPGLAHLSGFIRRMSFDAIVLIGTATEKGSHPVLADLASPDRDLKDFQFGSLLPSKSVLWTALTAGRVSLLMVAPRGRDVRKSVSAGMVDLFRESRATGAFVLALFGAPPQESAVLWGDALALGATSFGLASGATSGDDVAVSFVAVSCALTGAGATAGDARALLSADPSALRSSDTFAHRVASSSSGTGRLACHIGAMNVETLEHLLRPLVSAAPSVATNVTTFVLMDERRVNVPHLPQNSLFVVDPQTVSDFQSAQLAAGDQSAREDAVAFYRFEFFRGKFRPHGDASDLREWLRVFAVHRLRVERGAEGIYVVRDQMIRFVTECERHLRSRRVGVEHQLFEIQSQPSSGGSTALWHAIVALHDRRPTIVLRRGTPSVELAKHLLSVHQLVNVPLVLAADAWSRHQVTALQNELRHVPHALLWCNSAREGTGGSSDVRLTLSARMSKAETDQAAKFAAASRKIMDAPIPYWGLLAFNVGSRDTALRFVRDAVARINTSSRELLLVMALLSVFVPEGEDRLLPIDLIVSVLDSTRDRANATLRRLSENECLVAVQDRGLLALTSGAASDLVGVALCEAGAGADAVDADTGTVDVDWPFRALFVMRKLFDFSSTHSAWPSLVASLLARTNNRHCAFTLKQANQSAVDKHLKHHTALVFAALSNGAHLDQIFGVLGFFADELNMPQLLAVRASLKLHHADNPHGALVDCREVYLRVSSRNLNNLEMADALSVAYALTRAADVLRYVFGKYISTADTRVLEAMARADVSERDADDNNDALPPHYTKLLQKVGRIQSGRSMSPELLFNTAVMFVLHRAQEMYARSKEAVWSVPVRGLLLNSHAYVGELSLLKEMVYGVSVRCALGDRSELAKLLANADMSSPIFELPLRIGRSFAELEERGTQLNFATDTYERSLHLAHRVLYKCMGMIVAGDSERPATWESMCAELRRQFGTSTVSLQPLLLRYVRHDAPLSGMTRDRLESLVHVAQQKYLDLSNANVPAFAYRETLELWIAAARRGVPDELPQALQAVRLWHELHASDARAGFWLGVVSLVAFLDGGHGVGLVKSAHTLCRAVRDMPMIASRWPTCAALTEARSGLERLALLDQRLAFFTEAHSDGLGTTASLVLRPKRKPQVQLDDDDNDHVDVAPPAKDSGAQPWFFRATLYTVRHEISKRVIWLTEKSKQDNSDVHCFAVIAFGEDQEAAIGMDQRLARELGLKDDHSVSANVAVVFRYAYGAWIGAAFK